MMSDETFIQPVIQEAGGEYRINLPLFEGPMELLLYLIRKHDLAIRDIPIALLTEEYLSYLDTMKTLNVDLAGEFLVMAAELMHIKSQMLLPVVPTAEAEEDGVDPRADLVQRLLEYQRFKDAAQELDRRPMLQRDTHAVGSPDPVGQTKVQAPLAEGNVYQLIEAFDKLLRRIPIETYHTVAVDRISVSEKIYQLMEKLSPDRPAGLDVLLPERPSRFDVVITFLALLEMARLKMISLFQAGAHEQVYVTSTLQTDSAELKTVIGQSADDSYH